MPVRNTAGQQISAGYPQSDTQAQGVIATGVRSTLRAKRKSAFFQLQLLWRPADSRILDAGGGAAEVEASSRRPPPSTFEGVGLTPGLAKLRARLNPTRDKSARGSFAGHNTVITADLVLFRAVCVVLTFYFGLFQVTVQCTYA